MRHESRRAYLSLLRAGKGDVVPAARVLEERYQDGRRTKDVLEALVSERRQIMVDFMIRFDALIWFEMKPVDDMMSQAEQIKYEG